MRILVVGGSGFIGAPLTRSLLERGCEVLVAHRGETAAPPGARALTCTRGGLERLRAQLSGLALDAVVDLIAYTEADARETVEVFADLAPHLVVASSADVYRAYGLLHKLEDGPLEPLPLGESAALRTRLHPYRDARGSGFRDYEKLLVERVFLAAAVPATVLRLGMLHGPGDRQRRFWPLVRRMLDGRPVIPLESGWASWRGPYCFVANAAEALALAAIRPPDESRVFNVADPSALSAAECVEGLRVALDWSGELRILSREASPPHLRVPADALDLRQHLVLDTSRIRAELGHVEPFDAASALAATAEAERAQPGASPEAEYRAEDDALGG